MKTMSDLKKRVDEKMFCLKSHMGKLSMKDLMPESFGGRGFY